MRRAYFFFLIIGLYAPLCLSCSDGGETKAKGRFGGFDYKLAEDGNLIITNNGIELFALKGVETLSFKLDASMMFGFFKLETTDESSQALAFADKGNAVSLTLNGVEAGQIIFSATEKGNLRVSITTASGTSKRGMRLKFACRAEDRFWGFGEQYNYIDFKGRAVPILVQEQGVGREEEPSFPFIGKYTNSYFPMPYFIDPKDGKAFLLENSEYSNFDLCSADPNYWTLDVHNGNKVNFLVFSKKTPAKIISALTSELGRPKKIPPDWAFDGVWLAAQGGRDSVTARLKTALDAGVPTSALWVQDWVGLRDFGASNFGVKYRWNSDEELYPGLKEMIEGFKKQNVRFLGYFNPFITPGYEQYEEAAQKGYAIKKSNGEPYLFTVSTFKASLLDVSNPQAGDWFKTYARVAIDYGMSGWMADFGEWLPFDAAIANGDAASLHNLYPTLWHKLNRDALDEAIANEDYVMLTRSGFTGEQSVAQIVWAGDQESDFSEGDGIATVVKAALTMGLAGIPFFTHDIAGFSGGPSVKELFLRWTEMGAFTPFMRTHDGLKKKENWRFDSDAETLAHFTRFAKIHKALAPYFKKAAAEAVADGLPIIRHAVLVDPAWELSYEAEGQWHIGRDMIFAPVTAQGGAKAKVYLTEGEWRHLFDGKIYNGRTLVEIDAPIGSPAAFAKVGVLDELDVSAY